MVEEQSVLVNDTVYKLQLSLLEGIQHEDQLFAAGSVMSRGDYEDVVVERSISNLCGYPLCRNSLPSDRPQKGRYRISLKEHKVYDLHETYMYCSTGCVVNSQVFAGSLHAERCSVLNPTKLKEVLKLFDNLSLSSQESGNEGDLGLSNLKIEEKMEHRGAEILLDQWIGPSNAIEGYVPQRERYSKPSQVKKFKQVRLLRPKAYQNTLSGKSDFIVNDMDFTSIIITEDEYSISKGSSNLSGTASCAKSEHKGEGTDMDLNSQSSASVKDDSSQTPGKSRGERCQQVVEDERNAEVVSSLLNSSSNGLSIGTSDTEEKSQAAKAASDSLLKPSLKSSTVKKSGRSVTWADEQMDSFGSRNHFEVRKIEDKKTGDDVLCSTDKQDDDAMLRYESAETCALALSQAAESVASEGTDVTNAMSEAGLIILPSLPDVDQSGTTEDPCELEYASAKWPGKPGTNCSDIFDPEDSWFDAPPEGFSLTLSSFATMWMALFAWITSSSLAYIYGRDESSHEDYLFVNGREYPQKIVLGDGRSSEIKKSVEGCLARAFPAVIAGLRLSLPISTLELATSCLLDTMSFVDALPAFRMKQWQVIALLFLDALAVSRIPALTSHMINRRVMLQRLLDGAQISLEEYEVMRDLMVPLGRAPEFSAQSGG
ncbi:hypothetical protein K2173_009265 [Erythroxylum novogranatense]|uniref:RNA polymerase II subunit B1 CTD phosphatase RPAP2 homolog n=1 Tax=Erythroxylum novogranatense TaxID=1862640 RepID=A0AAV8SZY1_9ROSI|nr:hypothetical protein K2173_009265 [Erythroxylum novogranatense]